jgi:hypothetical protein
MRVLIVDTYYPAFLNQVYGFNSDLAAKPYRDQWQVLIDQRFGTSDFYSFNLQALGVSATELISNCAPLQLRWAREHGLRLRRTVGWRKLRHFHPPSMGLDWREPVLLAQMEEYRPDVVHFQNPADISPNLIKQIRRHAGLLTAQIASPYPPTVPFHLYDLVLSSFPHFVERWRREGIRSRHWLLGFEPRVLSGLLREGRSDVVFVGGFTKAHAARVEFFEELSKLQPFDWWGYGFDALSAHSPLRNLFRGPAWGWDMYRRVGEARISLNHHINEAREFANNMRLYEATGVGSMLLTEQKSNLSAIFQPETEVVTYRNARECANLAQHYLARAEERQAVAAAGQARTLRDHTWLKRMEEYVGFLSELPGL